MLRGTWNKAVMERVRGAGCGTRYSGWPSEAGVLDPMVVLGEGAHPIGTEGNAFGRRAASHWHGNQHGLARTELDRVNKGAVLWREVKSHRLDGLTGTSPDHFELPFPPVSTFWILKNIPLEYFRSLRGSRRYKRFNFKATTDAYFPKIIIHKKHACKWCWLILLILKRVVLETIETIPANQGIEAKCYAVRRCTYV